MLAKLVPIKESERHIPIDILRGFALLGILLVNMPTFHSPFLYLDSYTYWPSKTDQILASFVDLFAQSSFYPLFSFMFGYGAIIISDRSKEKGISFPNIFTKRLALILLFGCIHAFLIWNGDILITYGVTGFLFMLFYKLESKALLISGLAIYSIPFFTFFLHLVPNVEASYFANNAEAMRTSLQIYSKGSIGEIISQRLTDWLYVNTNISTAMLSINVLGLMLIGAAFAKQNWLIHVEKHKKLLKSLMLFGLIGGLGLKFSSYLPINNTIPTLLRDQFSGPLLALFYMIVIVFITQNQTGLKVLKALSNVGRMSMSNYLLQSVVFTMIFYSYGLGLYGTISYSTGFIMVFVFFGLQVLASKWWISHYQYGPLEYIWRWGTYGKKPFLKRKNQ